LTISVKGSSSDQASVPSLFSESQQNNERRPVATIGLLPGQVRDRHYTRCSALCTPDNFTIFEGTSEIQRMIIGRAVTGLDVR
jgi:hypothetical protein